MNLADLFDLSLLEQHRASGYVRLTKHPSLPLAILNYTERCAYDGAWDAVTLQCRGLIYHSDTLEVVARPFPKFFNHGQPGAPELDLDAPAVVTDKLDGSLGILYPTGDPGRPYAVATRGSFTSEQAIWATEWFTRYADLSAFAFGRTYLFEIVAAWNRIVCSYDWEGLALLAILDNESGRALDLPHDARLLQAWTPRDDAREHLGASDEGVDDVSRLQAGIEAPRHGAASRASSGVSEEVGYDERRATAAESEGSAAGDPGCAERCKARDTVRGLRQDVPSGLHGLRPRPGNESLQRGPGEDDGAATNGDREVRTRLCQLPPAQDAFRIIDLFPYVTLAEALAAEPRPNAEGVVVYLPDTGDRVKIKQDDYVAMHRILTGTNARNVWEIAAVRACARYVHDAKEWGSFLRIDPVRAEEVQALADDWLADVPDEFYGWIEETTADAEQKAYGLIHGADEIVGHAKTITDRRTRYEYVSGTGHPATQELMRLADGRDELARLIMRCWLEARPEPTHPFHRDEAVA